MWYRGIFLCRGSHSYRNDFGIRWEQSKTWQCPNKWVFKVYVVLGFGFWDSSQLAWAEASLALYNLLFLDSQVVRTEGGLELWNLLLLPFTAGITGVARAHASWLIHFWVTSAVKVILASICIFSCLKAHEHFPILSFWLDAKEYTFYWEKLKLTKMTMLFFISWLVIECPKLIHRSEIATVLLMGGEA